MRDRWSGTRNESANDRLKQGWRDRVSAGLIAAVAVHAAVFALWPSQAVATFALGEDPLEIVTIPDLVLPLPPEEIRRPARPVVADVPLEGAPEFTPVPWDEVPEQGPQPPAASSEGAGAQPRFVPHDTPPRMTNPDEVSRILTREYPSTLRDAGIGGTVRVWFRVDTAGGVVDTRVAGTSGVSRLDEAALAVAERVLFTPAYNRDRPVEVWVALPITFQVR